MNPTESLLPESIPEPLRETLRRASAINKNYDPERPAQSVAVDIYAALFTKDGKPRRQDVAMRRIALLDLDIRARVAQIRPRDGSGNPLWEDHDRGSTPEEFTKSPRTLLKSVQEVFTHPADRIAGQSGNQQIKDEQDTRLPSYVSISPLRLTDTFLTNLGLEKKLAESGSPAIDQLRAKVRTVPLIKQLLREVVPMSHAQEKGERRNYRMFRITKGPQTGKLLGAQEISGSERFYMNDLYGTKRRIEHIDTGYDEEQKELEDIRCTLAEVDMVISMDWSTARTPWRLAVLLSKLASVEFKLERARDQYKVKLYGAVKRGGELLAELNKGATRATIHKRRTAGLLGERAETMSGVLGHLSQDKLLLLQQIYTEEAVLGWLHDEVDDQDLEPLSNPGEPVLDDKRKDLMDRVRNILNRCKVDVKFQPNLAFAQKLEVYLSRTLNHLGFNPPSTLDRGWIAESFVRAYIISKLARFNNFSLALYEAFSVGDGKRVNPAYWKENLEQANQELFHRDLAGSIYTGEYNQLWQDLREFIKNLRAAIEEFEKDPLLKQDRSADVERIKLLIAEFDLPARVANTRIVPLRR